MTHDLNESFEKAYRKWRSYCEQPILSEQSSDLPYINNSPFRDIIALGQEAIPLIVAKMKNDRNAHFLIHALRQITGKAFSSEEIETAKQKYGAPLGNQGYAQMWIDWWEGEGQKGR